MKDIFARVWVDGNWTPEAESFMLKFCLVFGVVSLFVGAFFR